MSVIACLQQLLPVCRNPKVGLKSFTNRGEDDVDSGVSFYPPKSFSS
jgi:hypothetical protein